LQQQVMELVSAGAHLRREPGVRRRSLSLAREQAGVRDEPGTRIQDENPRAVPYMSETVVLLRRADER
jgi:hypothetical protein